MVTPYAGFIAAIREEPNDDAPRLVCADWLEEQGDEAGVARAEFIRIQIERANLPPEDVRHSALQARELRLLKRFVPVWCGPHFVFKKVRFRRGFIEGVHLHLRHFLHHRRQIFALEPVRDVRLTGFYRAPDDLVRRVAACEEWKNVETLRIHHQGPHHDPRSNLVLLLESPHLTGLRTLHGTHVAFDADARRRFERLPLLRRVRELYVPTLDRFPENPGEWFSDGGTAFSRQWEDLRSLALPFYLRMDLLRLFSEMPFWKRLSSLALGLPLDPTEALSILRDRMPESLQALCLYAGSTPANFSALDSFLERLAQVPFQTLNFSWIPLSPAALGRLLDGTNRWKLRDLNLSGCDLTADHARIIAGSPGTENLLSLNLSANWDFDAAAAQALFSSERFRSLVHLDLNSTRIGTAGAMALASAKGWDRLRSLNLSEVGVGNDGLRALLASPNLKHLTWLTIGGSQPGEPTLDVTPVLAAELTQLPHLASLRLRVPRCDPRSRQILLTSDSLAWPLIDCYDDWDIQSHRANLSPARWPPVDEATERYAEW